MARDTMACGPNQNLSTGRPPGTDSTGVRIPPDGRNAQESPMADTVHDIVARARTAQAAVGDWTQAQVDEIVAAVGWNVYQREHAEACARLACDETGMGIYEDKVLKHRKKTLGTLRDLQDAKTVGLIEEDRSRGLLKFAKPNITWKHFINTTWVSLPIAPVIPDEDVLFGAFWAKHGK
jgi:hypothetical protein